MALTVRNVSKTFGTNKAVDNLSFEIAEPGIFGLLGTNGAGKTTTIRMILGIMSKDEGEILWDGKEVSRKTVSYGYMPEERGIYPKVRVFEQLVYFGCLRGMNRHDARNPPKAGWKDWRSEYTNMIADKLSKGNQQKIQLIAALIHDPTLIFLDELSAGLTPSTPTVQEYNRRAQGPEENHNNVRPSDVYNRTVLQGHSNLDRGRTVLKGNLRK